MSIEMIQSIGIFVLILLCCLAASYDKHSFNEPFSYLTCNVLMTSLVYIVLSTIVSLGIYLVCGDTIKTSYPEYHVRDDTKNGVMEVWVYGMNRIAKYDDAKTYNAIKNGEVRFAFQQTYSKSPLISCSNIHDGKGCVEIEMIKK